MNIFKLFKKKPQNYNPSEIKSDEAKWNGYSVYHRIITQSENLTEKDYIIGFGINSDHYSKVSKARKEANLSLRSDFKETYEHKSRDGYFDITGKKIVSKYHPLHDKMLLDKVTGKKYHIDIVSIGYNYGKVMSLVTREEGSKSHGCKDWEIIIGGDPYTIQRVKENRLKYELIDSI